MDITLLKEKNISIINIGLLRYNKNDIIIIFVFIIFLKENFY